MWKIVWFWVVMGHPRSLKIAPFDAALGAYDFLLAFHSNHDTIVHRF